MIVGIENPMETPWEWELLTQLGWEWEGMGITLCGNGNDPYSHENKLRSADTVFLLCRPLIVTYSLLYNVNSL